ncbi:MAG TPA: hypothetical protein DIW15_02810 [Bavariicoccus seileri]|uniref:Uncharacterized protein n=1 Tax=Bavariicoccus seileri TaxID=549685 RepID=A0A3D4S4S3_9ENTE|nr:hypothetical protein [Bavariicoccus seileri]HCS93626.1 hypothetical protein [Bavariicoccus seileri]
MIVLKAPIQQDQIIALLEASTAENATFTFKEKKGLNLYFDVTGVDAAKGAKLAKQIVKAEPWGAVLYFQAEPVNE